MAAVSWPHGAHHEGQGSGPQGHTNHAGHGQHGYTWSDPVYSPPPCNPQHPAQCTNTPIVIQPIDGHAPVDGYHGQYGDPPPGYMDPHMNPANMDPNNYNSVSPYATAPQYTTNADQTYVSGSSATTLTPTTLQQVVGLPHRVQSGFVPPVIDRAQQQNQATDMTKFSYVATYGDDDSEWAPAAKRMKVIRHTPALPQGHLVASQLTPPAPRRQGGRRPQDTSNLSREEAEKKVVRRERNKVAAAKCRQRRVDHTNVLINKTECLEEEKSALENEISFLQQQKEQMEFLLKAHRPICDKHIIESVPRLHDESCCAVRPSEVSVPADLSSTASTDTHQYSPVPASAVPITIKQEVFDDDDSSSRCSTDSMMAPSVVDQVLAAPTTTATADRPSTLAIGRHTNATFSKVAITTPSRAMSGVYTIGLDSLVDGHTGLTPLTGMSSIHTGLTPGHTGLTPGHTGLTPCSTAHRNSSDSSSNEGMSSPTLLKL